MNTTVTPPPQPSRAPLPKRRMLWIVLAAMALGLLFFLILMLTQDRQKPFFSAGADRSHVDENGEVQVFEPLPAPLPAGESADASRLPEIADAEDGRAAPPVIEQPRRTVDETPAPTRPAPTTSAPNRTAASIAPVPTSQPAPRYPRDALRAGIEGTVQVQVDVGPDGVPTSVALAAGSGSRELDRAALDAVRRWRFRPAMANGQPTVGRVTVPIQFTVRN